MDVLERDDIQGLLLSAYSHLRCATYLMLRVDDAAAGRKWLGELAGEITTGVGKQAGLSSNVALTYAGLARLGLDEEGLATFSNAFRDGMTSQRRSKILGDAADSLPDYWQWGGPKSEEVHVLLM